MDGLQHVGVDGGEVLAEASFVMDGREGCQVNTGGAIGSQTSERTARRDIVVDVEVTKDVPKDEPILLDRTIRGWALEICGCLERIVGISKVTPVDKEAEIFNPLPKTCVGRLRAENDVWFVRAIEDAGIMWANVIIEHCLVPYTKRARCCCYGQHERRLGALELAAPLELSVADKLDVPGAGQVLVSHKLLRYDDPRVILARMRYDIRIDSPVVEKADLEVLPIWRRVGKYFNMRVFNHLCMLSAPGACSCPHRGGKLIFAKEYPLDILIASPLRRRPVFPPLPYVFPRPSHKLRPRVHRCNDQQHKYEASDGQHPVLWPNDHTGRRLGVDKSECAVIKPHTVHCHVMVVMLFPRNPPQESFQALLMQKHLRSADHDIRSGKTLQNPGPEPKQGES